VPDWNPDPGALPCWAVSVSDNDAVFQEVGKQQRWRERHARPGPDAFSLLHLLVLMKPTKPPRTSLPNQMLEDALREYEGAALLVSHDRYFILAGGQTGIVEIRDGELVLYRGDTDALLPGQEGRKRRN